MNKEPMIVQCAWCGCTINSSTGERRPAKRCPVCGYTEDFVVSHGICPECKARVLREWHNGHTEQSA